MSKDSNPELKKLAIQAMEALANQIETCAPLLKEVLGKPRDGAKFRKGAKELRKWIKTL